MDDFNFEEMVREAIKEIDSLVKKDKRFKKKVIGTWSSGENQLCYVYGGNKPQKTLLIMALEDQEEICGVYGCIEAIRVLQQNDWNIKAFIIPIFDKGPNVTKILKGREVNSYDNLKLATEGNNTIFKPEGLKVVDTKIEEILIAPLESKKLLAATKPNCGSSKQAADGIAKYLKDKIDINSYKNILISDFDKKMVYVAVPSKLELPWYSWDVLPSYGCYHLKDTPSCTKGVKELLKIADIFITIHGGHGYEKMWLSSVNPNPRHINLMITSLRKEGIKVFSKEELEKTLGYSNFPDFKIKDGWEDGTAQNLKFCAKGLTFSPDVLIASQPAKSAIIYELRGPLDEARRAVHVSLKALLKELHKNYS